MATTMLEELAEQFSEVVGVDLTELGLADACLSICQTYGLSAEDLAIKWDAFSMRGEGAVIERKPFTSAGLEDFRGKVLSKLRTSQPQFLTKGGRGASLTRDSLYQLDARKRAREPGGGGGPNREVAFGTPAAAGGGARGGGGDDEAASPLTSGASAQYVERKNAGKVEATLHAELGIRAGAGRTRAQPLAVDASEWRAAEGIGRHMWERLEDKAAALDRHAHLLGQAICAGAALEPPGNVMRASVDESTAVGRIVCDSEGKVNAQSVFLETTRASSAGVRVKLDLSDVPDFVTFRGQVVAVRATNARGNLLSVRALLSAAPRAPPPPPPPAEGGGARVLVACGPYTTDDSLGYAPFLDLLAAAERHGPDALVLLGPFVDEAHPAVKAGSLGALTFEMLFREKVVDVLHAWLDKQRAAGRAPPTIVLAPSAADVHAHPTFPQAPLDPRGARDGLAARARGLGRAASHRPAPPLPARPSSNGAGSTRASDPSLVSVRNPATLSIGGFAFSLCAFDSIKALGAEECARVSLPPSQREDRMSRLCRQLLEQRVFLPLYPPPKDAAVDISLALVSAAASRARARAL